MKQYIKGQYKRSVFNSGNGYTIGLIKVTDTNDQELTDFIDEVITFTGYFAELKENDMYILYGELIDHPKYGIQYQVNEYENVLPSDKDGIIEFLSSNLFKGIGKKLATNIVDILGENSLELILEEKNNLKKVPKITNQKIDTIYNTLEKYRESHQVVVSLTELGFNMRDSLAIYNYYKESTMLILKTDIYQLIDTIEEINFSKVDEVAKKFGIDETDSRRVKACIIYTVKNLTFKNGDTYSLYDEIKNNTLNYLRHNINDDEFILLLDELRYENKLVLDEEKYYLREMYDDEMKIVSQIIYLINKEKEKINNFDDCLKNTEELFNIEYSEKQKESIKKALENNFLVITGGPGTGKTTIIKAIVNIYMLLNNYTYEETTKKIALLAPTGRASKRMSEATLFPATTIHRYLKWNKESNSFNVNELSPNKEEFIIIDEVSMIDTYLLANLFRGITKNTKIIFVGDYNQLPSVGAGQILKDIIESKKVDVIELDLLYRQSEDSYISKLADDIKNDVVTEEVFEDKINYTFLTCRSESILNNIKNITKKIIDKEYTYKQFQILAPMYAGINGIDIINKELQNIFNPKEKDRKEIKYGDIVYRENDKVLQLVNLAEYNVFNGDIGIIKEIVLANKSESGKNEVYIDYDGVEVKYLPKDFHYIKHGYAISIHKSQGSEFDIVLMPVTKNYYKMLYKKLLYTGITRTKNKLILIGEQDAFIYGINNKSETKRKTTLKNKLNEMYKK